MTTPQPDGPIRKRTLRVTARGLFALITAMSETDIRVIADPLPKGAAMFGTPRWDPDTQTLELDVFHHRWPNDPDDETIGLLYARRVRIGTSSPDEWGIGVSIDVDREPPRPNSGRIARPA